MRSRRWIGFQPQDIGARVDALKIFLAGIMQGSHVAATMHDQDYRANLKRLLAQHWPDAMVYDPLADHTSSLDYTPDAARQVFLKHNQMCGEVDVLIAFVPEASMGTAIEMWEASRHGRVVVTVSPLDVNWTVQFCSDLLYPNIESLEAALARGELQNRVRQVRTAKLADIESRSAALRVENGCLQ